MDVNELAIKFALQSFTLNRQLGKYVSPQNLAIEAYSYAEALVSQAKRQEEKMNVKETPILKEEDWTPLKENV